MKRDAELRQDVLDELDWEPSVTATDIGVAVKDGVVTLTGFVPSFAEKYAAEKAALRVAGVKAIAEEIEVRLPSANERTDAEIARAALDALSWHVYLAENAIRVKVEDGWVSLEGELDWQYQRKKAYEAVRHLTGVRGVFNLIQIKPRATSSEVKAAIRKALQRAATEDADQITVEVQNGVVKLGGAVRSLVEREDAERAAWSAPGVVEVEDKIRVEAAAYA